MDQYGTLAYIEKEALSQLPKSWKFNQQIKNELEKNQHPPVYFALTLQPVLSL